MDLMWNFVTKHESSQVLKICSCTNLGKFGTWKVTWLWLVNLKT